MSLIIKASHCRDISLIFIVLLLSFLESNAQRDCGTHGVYKEIKKNDSDLSNEQENSQRTPPPPIPYEGLVTIPTVFHVLYNNDEENLSDEQIQSQLDVLNEDFQLLNTDIDTFWADVIGNAEMEFCLATRDKYGNPTCGITRTYTDSTVFTLQSSPKDESTGGISGWPATDYLNVFICDIANLRGYATFPNAVDSIDGIVIDYLSFGRGVEWAYTDSIRLDLLWAGPERMR